jgi:hypothetical protein
MFLRRHRKWGEEVPMATTAVAPGAHDLLAAADAGSRNGSTHGGRRLSVSLQVTSSDLSVGFEESHVVTEQSNDGFVY